jgi:hypothetical protein
MGIELSSAELEAINVSRTSRNEIRVVAGEAERLSVASWTRLELGSREGVGGEETASVALEPRAFQGLGVLVEATGVPGVVRVTPKEGTTVRCESRTHGRQTPVQDLPDGAALLDFRLADCVVLTALGGAVLGLDGASLYCVPLLREVRVQPIAALPAVPADVRANLGDPWLAERVGQQLAADDPWQHAVAASMLVRLAKTGSVRLDERLSRDHPPSVASSPSVQRVLEWARSLEPPQRRTLQQYALVELSRIAESLDALEQYLDLDSRAWVDELLAVCVERDDVEGVRWVLERGGPALELAEAASVVDRQGDLMMSALPREVAVANEHLQRALEAEPEAWWCSPAQWALEAETDEWLAERAPIFEFLRQLAAAGTRWVFEQLEPFLAPRVLALRVGYGAPQRSSRSREEFQLGSGLVLKFATTLDRVWVSLEHEGVGVSGVPIVVERVGGNDVVSRLAEVVTDDDGEATLGAPRPGLAAGERIQVRIGSSPIKREEDLP